MVIMGVGLSVCHDMLRRLLDEIWNMLGDNPKLAVGINQCGRDHTSWLHARHLCCVLVLATYNMCCERVLATYIQHVLWTGTSYIHTACVVDRY